MLFRRWTFIPVFGQTNFNALPQNVTITASLDSAIICTDKDRFNIASACKKYAFDYLECLSRNRYGHVREAL